MRNVLHVEGAHNTLSQSILMDRGLRIVPANSYGLRIHATGTGHGRRGELVGGAPQVGGLSQFGVVSAGGGTRKPSQFGGAGFSSDEIDFKKSRFAQVILTVSLFFFGLVG